MEELMNKKNQMNGLDLMTFIDNEKIKLAFFDPQYRGVMDKLNYGNEGSRQKKRAELPQMSEEIIINFISEINRVLVPSGHLMLWIDKFHLVEGIHNWLKNTDLNIVDMITWDKGKIGMGYRSRRKSEYLMIIQKSPKRVKGCWTLHNIPDVWQEKIIITHAHSKPPLLQKALIEATTNEGDLVMDPASGGWSVFECCKETNRNFIGSDLIL